MKTIKRFLPALVCVLIAGASHAAKKPNVVFIITDDQSWDSLAFMGGKVHTPRIDQMAEEGLYLTDFNVTSTVCSPSRYSFLTGRYAGRCTGERFMHEHPLGDQTQVENIGELEPDRWNLAKVLQQNGYKTGFVGKSHLINHEWINGSWEKAGLEPYAPDADPSDPEVSGKMQRNHKQWCEAMKPYGFDYVDGYYCANLKELRNDALNVHNLDWSVSKAFKFLEESKGEPWTYRLQFQKTGSGFLIMLSTSVLGIHWLTDIVAGLATGVLAVTVARLMERSITWPAES